MIHFQVLLLLVSGRVILDSKTTNQGELNTAQILSLRFLINDIAPVGMFF